MERNGGRAEEGLKGLPRVLIAVFWGLLLSCRDETEGPVWNGVDSPIPPEIVQTTRKSLSRFGGGSPVIRSIMRSALIGRRRTSSTANAWRKANHVGMTRRNVPLDSSSFLITLLRRGMGGKRNTSLKSHFWLRASIASGTSAAFQEKKHLVWTDWREAKRSICGGPLRDDIWWKTLGARCQSGIYWNLEAASA
jgi:hypothetical protein